MSENLKGGGATNNVVVGIVCPLWLEYWVNKSVKIRRGGMVPTGPPLAPTALHREQPQQIWADPFRISVKSASARDTKTRTDLKVGFKILNSKASSLVTLFIYLYGI